MALPSNPGPSLSQFGVPQAPFGNLAQIGLLSVAVAPASVAATTSAEQTFTVTGLQTTDAVFVSKPSAQAGLAVATARVSASNTLAVTFVNASAGAITPTTETYQLMVLRPQPFVASNLQTAMPLL